MITGIVTKGNVKVAISTNGKSPTTAKRLRQFFEEVIPENIDDLVKACQGISAIGKKAKQRLSLLSDEFSSPMDRSYCKK